MSDCIENVSQKLHQSQAFSSQGKKQNTGTENKTEDYKRWRLRFIFSVGKRKEGEGFGMES